MKTLLIALLFALPCFASDRFVSLEIPLSSGPLTERKVSLTLAQGEVAKLVSFPVVPNSRAIWFGSNPSALWMYQDSNPLVVVGPSTIELRGSGGVAVFEITPNVFSADKTVVIPSGPGGGNVQLEVSTDLVHWTASSSGSFTNQPAPLFFRIKLERIAAVASN